MDYFLGLLTETSIWAIAAISLCLLMSYIGLFTLCQVSFMAFGAYSSAILTTNFGWTFIPALLVGMAISCAGCLLIALPSLRVHINYFVITTLTFLYLTYYSINNAVGLTGGSEGIKRIPYPNIFGLVISSPYTQFLFVFITLILIILLTTRLVNSPFGRMLKAINEDEIAVKSLGKNVIAAKLIIVVISAAIASIAGSLFAHFERYIHPLNFYLDQTFMLACIVILGGLYDIKGIVLATFVLVGFPELSRFTQIPYTLVGTLREFFYGLMIVLIVLFRPQGLIFWGRTLRKR